MNGINGNQWLARSWNRAALGALSAMALIWVGACSDSPKGPSVCDTYTDHLRTCGFLSEGEWQGCQLPETEEARCEISCATEAECADVLPLVCEDTRAEPVAACILECTTTTCKDGGSVHKDKLCDMELDCNDGSDEAGCPDSFLCADGSAVMEAWWRCDGHSDCSDDSDEAGCAVDLCGDTTASKGPVTTDGGPTCTRMMNKLTSCGLISAGFRSCEEPHGAEACLADCFLAASCSDLESAVCEDSDLEDAPPSVQACLATCFGDEGIETEQFLCADGTESVPGDWVCDGMTDCEDGSDEENCDSVSIESSGVGSMFACADDTQEFPGTYVCDGVADCGDGSDEKGCDGFRTCADGLKTIADYRFCNSIDDCADGSDEDGCAVLDCNPEALLSGGGG